MVPQISKIRENREKNDEFQNVSPDIVPFKSSLVSMCSPRRARLNVLRGFFHAQFIEEILAKY